LVCSPKLLKGLARISRRLAALSILEWVTQIKLEWSSHPPRASRWNAPLPAVFAHFEKEFAEFAQFPARSADARKRPVP
jgi:hypothetical protein